MIRVTLACLCLLVVARSTVAADFETSETLQLPESHSLGWVKAATQPRGSTRWDFVVTDDQWQAAVKEYNERNRSEGKLEEATFDLWIPLEADVVRGVVVVTGHGSGTYLYRHPELRKLARELKLAVFKFNGNPVQRGFWPSTLIDDRLAALGAKAKHPEITAAPIFLYGHSNGTGFSALVAARQPERVWAWISMRPGTTLQTSQPRAAGVPGLIIFGEDDPYFAKPSQAENIGVVQAMRKEHDAVWNYAVEPKTGHGPGEKTWPLVFSFLRHTFQARVPKAADPRQGPPKLNQLDPQQGRLGQGYDVSKGGYQDLATAPYNEFPGDKSTAPWLINKDYAADWRQFQREGEIRNSPGERKP